MQHPVVPLDERASFSLPPAYLDLWRDFHVPMSTTGLVTLLRTYAGTKPDGTLETWFDVCKRVVEGAFSIYRYHMKKHGMRPDREFEDRWSRRMFESMMRLEWCPAGRGLQHMGHDRMWERGGALLNSCAFVSTEDDQRADWLYFLADMSMLGVGVGFDTRGAGMLLHRPSYEERCVHTVEDTREGWAGAFQKALCGYLNGGASGISTWDFSEVRPAGTPLRTMGGIASGPAPLVDSIQLILRTLDPFLTFEWDPEDLRLHVHAPPEGAPFDDVLTAEQILDIGNAVGVCVVSGGIRRSAEICLFDDRTECIETAFSAKRNQQALMSHRWASNNSILLSGPKPLGFFKDVVESCRDYGDPGLVFLHNVLGKGRAGEMNAREVFAAGTNPCGEQILENYEVCNLVETVPGRGNHQTVSQCAFLYGKLVSLLPIHHPTAHWVVHRNRRIGVSLTGWTQFAYPNEGARTPEFLSEFLRASYDAIGMMDLQLQKHLPGVPLSIKTTSVKPSGSVSLVLGTSPGMNPHFAQHYIRRINIENTSPLLSLLQADGYKAEPNIYSPTSHVVEFPCEAASRTDFSAVQQLEVVKMLQHHWSDNMVSNTIVFDDHEVDEIAEWVYVNQWWLRSLSFLRRKHGFAQPPLEAIDEAEYERRVRDVTPPNPSVYARAGARAHDTESEDKWCDGGRCDLSLLREVPVEESAGTSGHLGSE